MPVIDVIVLVATLAFILVVYLSAKKIAKSPHEQHVFLLMRVDEEYEITHWYLCNCFVGDTYEEACERAAKEFPYRYKVE